MSLNKSDNIQQHSQRSEKETFTHSLTVMGTKEKQSHGRMVFSNRSNIPISLATLADLIHAANITKRQNFYGYNTLNKIDSLPLPKAGKK